MPNREPTLIHNPNIFNTGHHPRLPLGYEHFLDSVVFKLAKVLDPQTHFIELYGGIGTGKTTFLNAISEGFTQWLNQKRDETSIVFQYACHPGEKPKSVFQSLLQELGVDLHVDNKYVGHVWCRVEDELKRQDLDGVYLFLDDVDNLVRRNDFIDSIVRYNGDTGLGIFVTASQPDWVSDLSLGTKSRYKSFPHRISIQEFFPFSVENVQAVLQLHVNQGVNDGVVSDTIVEKLATRYWDNSFHGYNGAVAVLYWAIQAADNAGVNAVSESHLQSGFEQLRQTRETKYLNSLPLDSQHHALLLALLVAKQAGELPVRTGEVYDRYYSVDSQAGMKVLSERRFRDRLTSLRMSGVIETNLVNHGRKNGRGYEVDLAFSPEAVRTVLAEADQFEHSVIDPDDGNSFGNVYLPLV